jgi:16S rRNA (adenine1518-N6/adenine1519-N6)-dimethyltransferase
MKMESLLENLPPLRDVIAAHSLRAEKALGQNFLLDQNLTDKIARQVDAIANKNVIEIGPGPGGLTRSLLRAGAKSVTAIEFDPRAVAALQDLSGRAQGRLRVIHADALQTNVLDMCEGPRVIVANLPYNIATPLLTGWLAQIRRSAGAYDEMILMFQKEVAERIVAAPSTKAYGRISILAQWLCETKKLFDLPPSAFTPPPKVTSSVVRFRPRALEADAPPIEAVEALTAAAFGQRRKMIRSSLKAYLPQIEALGLDSSARAENLPPSTFIALAKLT